MLALSVIIGAGSSLAGIWISFWLDSAPAPTIVVVMTGLFTLVFLWRQMTHHWDAA
jgi:manganese/iron transport system permease protein